MIKTYQGTVYPWHCDHMGHMNVKYYAEKFDMATWNLLAALGLTAAYFRETKTGAVALEQHIKYRKEVLPGDNIHIESGIIELKNKTIRFQHLMYNSDSGELAAEAEMVGLYLDTEKRKGIAFPDFVGERAERLGE